MAGQSPSSTVVRSWRMPMFSATRREATWSGCTRATRRESAKRVAAARQASVAACVAMPASRSVVDVPADLHLGDLLELQRSDAAVAREARMRDRFDQPGPDSARRVELAVDADPGGGFVPRLRPWVERHLLVVRDHGGEDVEIVVAELPQPQAVAHQLRRVVRGRAQA
jgi:hypothetical protein